MLYWECNRRLTELRRFRELVIKYAETCPMLNIGRRIETEESGPVRDLINLGMGEVVTSCNLIGHSLSLIYTPPPMFGGPSSLVNVVVDIFQLNSMRLPLSKTVDLLDRAIGDYERMSKKLYRKLFNPFYWVGLLLSVILGAPFRILTLAGFNGEAAEKSLFGRLAKAVVGFVVFLAAFLQCLSLLGYQTSLGHIVGVLKHR
jgi:hypothetical protein